MCRFLCGDAQSVALLIRRQVFEIQLRRLHARMPKVHLQIVNASKAILEIVDGKLVTQIVKAESAEIAPRRLCRFLCGYDDLRKTARDVGVGLAFGMPEN